MKRRRFVQLMAGAAGYAAQRASGAPPLLASDQPGATHPLLGMYIHEGWPYRHPYAARTWSLDDWRGYADGMRKIGYNTFAIWPVLETMPNPLTPSDRAHLDKTSKVIDLLHNEFGMRCS